MNAIRRLIGRRISSDAFDHYWGERFLYVCAMVFIAVGIRALPAFTLSGGEYFLAILGVLNLGILLMIGGMLLGFFNRRQQQVRKV